MVGGFIGVVLTGVFASLAVNALGTSGGLVQFGRQAVPAGGRTGVAIRDDHGHPVDHRRDGRAAGQ